MPLTVVENIAAVLKTRLDTLLVDGTEETTASTVERPRRFGNYRPQDWQIVLTQGTTDINEELSYPGNPPATCFETTFNIKCRILPSDKETDSFDTLMNQVAADVRIVVCTPATSWYSFGGYAIDADWLAHEKTVREDEGSVTVPILIRYRTDENDPYTVRG